MFVAATPTPPMLSPALKPLSDEMIDHINKMNTTWKAFGAVGAISDRICIHTNGKVQVNISAEDLVSCCGGCGYGCKGGYPPAAWDYYKKDGIVTGGLYGTEDGCQPYVFPPCEHRTKGPRPPCKKIQPTPRCMRACRKGYGKGYSEDKHFGVYKKMSSVILGGHAIRIIGWGTENGVPYWLVANSWNNDWGDKGYFKILRGQDECGIEDGIHAGIPKE
ncbi:hypothetical protein HPB49_020391 [Dermacentor silvarum]|uniref:Uncharacterized protein n=1 Tax=Dermacentor silvarum TaxID=543639 RepID=A0ACB8DFZ0_DERSI|nr:hypothetical protein HPB49_020391 [Dermacentor silvarum]